MGIQISEKAKAAILKVLAPIIESRYLLSLPLFIIIIIVTSLCQPSLKSVPALSPLN